MRGGQTARQQPRTPGWGGLVTATLLVGSVPMVLWMVENPVAGAVVLGATGIVVAAAVVSLRTAESNCDQSDATESLTPVQTGQQSTQGGGSHAIQRR